MDQIGSKIIVSKFVVLAGDGDASESDGSHNSGDDASDGGGPGAGSDVSLHGGVGESESQGEDDSNSSDNESLPEEKPELEPSSPDSILSKETLMLGEEPSASTESDSSSHFQCSQVSSGWLGRAYNQDSRMRKKQESKEANVKKLAQEPSLQAGFVLDFDWYDINVIC